MKGKFFPFPKIFLYYIYIYIIKKILIYKKKWDLGQKKYLGIWENWIWENGAEIKRKEYIQNARLFGYSTGDKDQ